MRATSTETAWGEPICGERLEPVDRKAAIAVKLRWASTQTRGLKTRFVDAGCLSSFESGRRGLDTNSPPQLGQTPAMLSAQPAQKVHSKEQILALPESGGRLTSHFSQPGLSCSMLPLWVDTLQLLGQRG